MRAYKALFAATSLSSSLIVASLAAPAWAQSTPASGQPAQSSQPHQPGAAPPTQQTEQPAANAPVSTASVGELVVTGSLIKTTTFNSPAPLDVITAEQSALAGNVDTTQILQLSPIAANSEQINNFFSGLVGFAGGAGANTLSLRGLGSDRTLILLNGERMGPAGVGGEVGPIDLNTIPASMIDHIEILKDGASSIYGSDAVAGVVNIITKTTQDGVELHAFGDAAQHDGGGSYELNGSWGKTFDKGYITAGFDYFHQSPVYVGSRNFLDCSRDLVKDAATGKSADIIDPSTGQDKCFNAVVNTVIDVGQEDINGIPNAYIANPSAVAGGGPFGLDVPGFQAAGLQICTGGVLCPPNPAAGMIDTAASKASLAVVPFNDAVWNKATALSPVTRYTFSLFGGYDLTPHVQLYTSVLINQRDSSQTSPSQFFTLVDPGNPFNPGFFIPEPVIPQLTTDTQSVNYYRVVLGAKGDLPNLGTFKNWTYDIYGQYALSDGTYTEQYVKNDRVNATAGASTGTNGCDLNAIVPFGFGSGETMAQAEPGVACVPVNYFAAVARGGFTPQEFNFLYATGQGSTTYEHAYIDGSITGDVFDLPAGPLSAALGFQIRHEALDDRPPADFVNHNVYNETTVGVTKGSEDTQEVYGEFQIPVLRDFPLVKALNIDVSGRYSNYSSFGGNFTYKTTVDWKVTDWFALRGTYGTAFRAPALFELFLADQTGFLDPQGIDPCINYATSGVSPTIQKNCASQGIPGNFSGGLESITINTGGGAGHLKPETSDAETIGFVLTPHLWNQDINLAIDYYDFDIDNQINQFGPTNILLQCYGSTNFPANPFCGLFTRDLTPGDANFQAITEINNDFVNISKQLDQGLDVDLQSTFHINDAWKFSVDANLDWTFYNVTFLLGGQTDDFLGTIGSPKFVGTTDFRFDHGPWTFNWLLYMIGPSSDKTLVPTTLTNFRGTGETVVANYSVPFYSTSTIAIRRKFDKFTLEAGVKNLFDQAPPNISDGDPDEFRIGTVTQAVSQYDLIGRQFYFDIDAKF